MTFPTYTLAPAVHVCQCGGRLVFLNLKTDRYLALGFSQSEMVSQLLTGEVDGVNVTPQVRTLVDRLQACGLLVSTAAPAPALAPCVSTPVKSFLGFTCPRQAITARETLRFFQASRTANRMLKAQPIINIIDRVRMRKANRQFEANSATADQVCGLVHNFGRLRPIYRRPALCLFDSLALLEFLSKYGHYPAWVFGVTVDPFAAHCWVQNGDTLYNDHPDIVSHYTPIMVV